MKQRVRLKSAPSRIERRKAQTHRRLLEVARQLFSQKGIYWVKIEDITEAADLGKGTFYKYFDSKEGLLLVLLQEGLDTLLATTEEAVRRAPESKPWEAVISARVDFFLERPDYLLLFHQVRGLMQLQVEAAKDLRAVYDLHLRRIARLLKLPARSKWADDHNAAIAIAAYTSGLLTYYLLFETRDDLRRRRNEIVKMLKASI